MNHAHEPLIRNTADKTTEVRKVHDMIHRTPRDFFQTQHSRAEMFRRTQMKRDALKRK